MDVDTRLLRYFAAVVEEGSLTGAAKRLFVSQPALTKQIRRLEDDLGVRLFVRSRSGMAVTEAGHELASRVPALLDGWEEAVQATGRAARVLRLGFLDAGAVGTVHEGIAEFRRAQPEWRVELRQFDWSDPSAGLARGEVDAAVVRLPFPGQEGFAVRELFAEERGVLLQARHPLANSETVEFRELWDEPFVAAGAETGAWREHWLAAKERDEHPIRVGAVTSRPDEWLGAVAGGCVALAPASVARFYSHPDVVFRAVRGVSPSRVGLARRRRRMHEAVLNELLQAITATA
ncbi:putative LysR-family transcriptional regulator [Streptomyces ambofaciens ATCC 23877]|uniref:Putative LysR-family transcriptional regulator n=1 Tax=Streptomyces ambofaciens (strain ATCC 23877 / 3486 / DSM 40053 / JCM 4204 / NBRC 12836 / NRRL B-2516) TaxID=278992 RepID=Q1RQK5_STRA7|nr:LysR family transcriptional regulator [Streptomyces ambofaciens]AKZ60442.1 putative LysR-family transcriptional regulator [Streptomyces ambofaciens ATCC 23877]CAI78434.1 putative LysR-family transcriptional regulator [Streptomyces ambofaciens ATCC 23877]CAJ87941.1 putative LysR-family transcriptional regulator [Streptomyces ambofaciens ATCC 23877]